MVYAASAPTPSTLTGNLSSGFIGGYWFATKGEPLALTDMATNINGNGTFHSNFTPQSPRNNVPWFVPTTVSGPDLRPVLHLVQTVAGVTQSVGVLGPGTYTYTYNAARHERRRQYHAEHRDRHVPVFALRRLPWTGPARPFRYHCADPVVCLHAARFQAV